MMNLTQAHYQRRRLESHVENRTVYTLQTAELNVYETHLHAEKVELAFGDTVLASMLRGKKVMHLRDNSFDFFPGESVVLPPGELMRIDFPEATAENPTRSSTPAYCREWSGVPRFHQERARPSLPSRC